MESEKFRSTCPISSTLDLIGDKWTLLIVRDLLNYGQRTYKDLFNAEEKISSARLADRLKKLESIKAITKNPHPTNKKVFIYELTEKGKDLAPAVVDLISWGVKYYPNHVSEESKEMAKKLKDDRDGTITFLKSK